MIVVVPDPEIATIAGSQGPDLVIVKGRGHVSGQGPDLVIEKGGGHVIVIMTGIDHAPGHMIVTMTEGDLVRDLEKQLAVHETLNHTCAQFVPYRDFVYNLLTVTLHI